MAYLVVLVLDNLDQCDALLDAWEATGVKGITILESSGLGRLRQAALRDDLPLLPSLRDLLEGEEVHHRTLFSVVESRTQVQALVAAAQAQVGDFSQSHTGLLFVVELAEVYGLQKTRPGQP